MFSVKDPPGKIRVIHDAVVLTNLLHQLISPHICLNIVRASSQEPPCTVAYLEPRAVLERLLLLKPSSTMPQRVASDVLEPCSWILSGVRDEACPRINIISELVQVARRRHEPQISDGY